MLCSLYILDTGPLPYLICKYFLSFCGLYFQFLDSNIGSPKAFKFVAIHFSSLFSFVPCDFNIISKKLLPNPKSWQFTVIFLLRVLSFYLLHVTLWSTFSISLDLHSFPLVSWRASAIDTVQRMYSFHPLSKTYPSGAPYPLPTCLWMASHEKYLLIKSIQ